jgi:hypothetical protein
MPPEEVELWRRDPVECIRELMGNPTFKSLMAYAPERVYDDIQGKVRIFDQTWTGDWWWDTQVSKAYITAEETDHQHTRQNSLLGRHLLQQSSPQIRPISQFFGVTRVHGLCT